MNASFITFADGRLPSGVGRPAPIPPLAKDSGAGHFVSVPKFCCVRRVPCANQDSVVRRAQSNSGVTGFPAGNNRSPEIGSWSLAPCGRIRRRRIWLRPPAAVSAPPNSISPAAIGRSAPCARSFPRFSDGSSTAILTDALRGCGRAAFRHEGASRTRNQPNEVNARRRASSRSVAVRAVKYRARAGASHRASFFAREESPLTDSERREKGLRESNRPALSGSRKAATSNGFGSGVASRSLQNSSANVARAEPCAAMGECTKPTEIFFPSGAGPLPNIANSQATRVAASFCVNRVGARSVARRAA